MPYGIAHYMPAGRGDAREMVQEMLVSVETQLISWICSDRPSARHSASHHLDYIEMFFNFSLMASRRLSVNSRKFGRP